MSQIPWLSQLTGVASIFAMLVATWVAIIVLFVLWQRMNKRLRRMEGRHQRLTQGVSEGNLTEVLDAHTVRLDAAVEALRAAEAKGAATADQLARAVQRVGLVRFNPFADTGGSLSFALALADANGDGVVLCNLHGRGESRFFAKPLRQWDSPLNLSEEEALAVSRARSGEGWAANGESAGRSLG